MRLAAAAAVVSHLGGRARLQDPRKYARAKELLIMDEEIKKARQTVEDVGAQM